MTKLASFDLEIAKDIPQGTEDWRDVAPLGISCAGIYLDGQPEIWSGVPQMSVNEARDFVYRLQELQDSGYTIVTWNGCAFDFAVLAEESGLVLECAKLAINHVDMMLLVTFQKGHYLGLDKACLGAGLVGKTHEVELKSGVKITEMSGGLAPELWRAGETEAVETYLKGDVEQTHDLAVSIVETKAIRWVSNRGRYQYVHVPKFYTVKECFDIPEPDTSWMTNPPTREQFVQWMPMDSRP